MIKSLKKPLPDSGAGCEAQGHVAGQEAAQFHSCNAPRHLDTWNLEYE